MILTMTSASSSQSVWIVQGRSPRLILLDRSSIKDRLVVGVPSVECCRQVIDVVVVAIEDKVVPTSVRSVTESNKYSISFGLIIVGYFNQLSGATHTQKLV